jgi:hypothetical protein
MKKADYHIGIDPGTKTGVAIWHRPSRELIVVETMMIHKAMELVRRHLEAAGGVRVVIEDARKRKWFGDNAASKQQGAGSIKRDVSIWEDALKDWGIDFELVAPKKGLTKVTPERFQLLTGYKGRTSNHSRDAALLVVGR